MISLRRGLRAATAALLLSASILVPACKRDEPPGPPRKVELSELLKDVAADSKKAEAKWAGKNIESTGLVNKVGEDVDTHERVVWVGSGRPLALDAIVCRLPRAEAKKADALQPKQRVTVRGRVGGVFFGNIMMTGCQLEAAPGG
ncbi:MAG: hypothetical protein QM820_44670 [Minicystis sp.]